MATENNSKRYKIDEQQVSSGIMHQPISIIIVGAGAASIQLAHTLWNETKVSPLSRSIHVTILEANDYVGGRVRSFSFEGHTVEMGANWISGRETAFDNPIWKLAKAIQLEGNVSGREDPDRMHVINISSGSNLGKDVTAHYLEQAGRFDNIYAKALHEMASKDATLDPKDDISVRFLLEKHGWTPKDRLSNLERTVEHNLLEVWVVDKLEELSGIHDMKAGANDMDLGQDEMFVEDPRGFNSIFQSLVADLESSGTTKILLNKEVTRIYYEPGNVKVIAKNVIQGREKIKVTDEEEAEEEYHADIVVSTVSLGVLQSGSIEFVPALPDWKIAALNEVKMFTFAKVFAKFRNNLLPPEKDYFVFISEGEDKRGHYPLWMRYKKATEKNLFMCYLGGDEARRVESLDEEKIKDEIQELFHRVFKESSNDDCRPESVVVTNWSRNPRFCGSYSSFPLGCFQSVPEEDFRSPLTGLNSMDTSFSEKIKCHSQTNDEPNMAKIPTLYFAGEAFDDKFNGWVQGGYLSGERVGKSILEALRPLYSETKNKETDTI